MQELVWSLTQEMFSSRVITPGKTRTSDLVWWWRQRVNDLGLGTWFQPSVDVQRRGTTADAARRGPGDRARATCCTATSASPSLRLNTDTQHMAYVLQPGETDAPAGLRRALANSNALQDIVMDGARPGRTGNEILAAARARMKQKGIDGTIYSHPIGLHGHGAGPLIGLWDYQDGVARPRRREGDSEHVVVDRAAGDDARRGVGRPAGAHGAGGGRDHRRRRGACAGRFAGRTSCSSFADAGRAAAARVPDATLLALVVGFRPA